MIGESRLIGKAWRNGSIARLAGGWCIVLGLALLVAAPAVAGTTLVSRNANGELGNDYSLIASISPSGRYVAFSSRATNLVQNDTNRLQDVFIKDRLTGEVELASVNSSEEQATGCRPPPGSSLCNWPGAVSASDRYVTFFSKATNLVPNDQNNAFDAFLRDRELGTTERVSVSTAGAEGNDDSIASRASVSATGRYVMFNSAASNLVPGDTNGVDDVFVRDRLAGTTKRVSLASNSGDQANGESVGFEISPSGRHVSFQSDASNLVPGDTNNGTDAFVRDLRTGETERVSLSSEGQEGINCNYFGQLPCGSSPVMSADARYIAFVSVAPNLVPDDTNGEWDIFVRDREADSTERVSITSHEQQASEWSQAPDISGDGRYVAFNSGAIEFDPCPHGSYNDCFNRNFVRDRSLGTTQQISVSSSGEQGNAHSYSPTLSLDGNSIAFWSEADNLVPDDTNDVGDVFVRVMAEPSFPGFPRISLGFP